MAVPGEVLLEELIRALVASAVDRAGADRALLIRIQEGQCCLDAEARRSDGQVTVRRVDARAGPDDLPESLLRHVIRTLETVALDDASLENAFSRDPYIVEKRCRSIFCLPLVRDGSPTGAVYLENNLGPRVFTPTHVDALKALGSHAALALESARMGAQAKAVLDTIPTLVSTCRPDGWVDYFNRRWLDYTGRSMDEMLGWGWMETIHPDDRDPAFATMRDFLATGKTVNNEGRIRGADGTYRWFLGRSVPVHTAAGEITGWYTTATEIEDRKRAEESLRRSEAYLAQGQRLSHTGSFGLRLCPQQVVWSKETFRLLGLDEMTRPSLETIFQRTHPEDVELVRRALDAGARNGTALDFEHRLLMPDGSVKHVHVVADAVRDDAGHLEFVGAMQDITASKKAFDEIRTLRDRLFRENVALREEVDKASMFEDIVGRSPALREALSRLNKVAPTDSTVLITGETGTGKELFARAIHRRSPRSSRAFVAVSCAVIPKELVASELFGHERGSFTGAAQRRLGRFELADGGTLLLDEVGEIPADIQVALLRVLEERRFERVGAAESIPTDVRVIAATNRDLDAAINAGAFRQDLFYRLNVFPIHVPALRERREDIPVLVEYFIERFATRAGKKFSSVDKRSLELLESYHWPGNIRELQNVIERSVIVCESRDFSVDENWLASGVAAKPPTGWTLGEQLVHDERRAIEAALRETGGKISGPSGAAVKLGMPATTLSSRIQSLQIDRRRFKRS